MSGLSRNLTEYRWPPTFTRSTWQDCVQATRGNSQSQLARREASISVQAEGILALLSVHVEEFEEVEVAAILHAVDFARTAEKGIQGGRRLARASSKCEVLDLQCSLVLVGDVEKLMKYR